MSIHKLIVASALSVLSVGVVLGATARAEGADKASPTGQCEPKIVRAQTHFPEGAQARGEGGLVRIEVVLDKSGQVAQTKVARSSRSKVLDDAAQKSVSADWRFDVSHCAASAFPVTKEINVLYQRTLPSFSASLDRHGVKYAKQAAADSQCSVVPASGSKIISCIQQPVSNEVAALVQKEELRTP